MLQDFLGSSTVVAAVMASATAVMAAATVVVSLGVVVPFDVAVPFDALAPTAVVTTATPAGAPAPAPAGPPRHDVGRLVRVGGAVVERGLGIVVVRFAVERGASVAPVQFLRTERVGVDDLISFRIISCTSTTHVHALPWYGFTVA